MLYCSYDIGGYQLPFLLGAGLAFIDVLVVALLMDDATVVASPAPVPDDETDFSWRDVLKHRCKTRASVIRSMLVRDAALQAHVHPRRRHAGQQLANADGAHAAAVSADHLQGAVAAVAIIPKATCRSAHVVYACTVRSALCAGDDDKHRPHVCGWNFGLWLRCACQWLAE